MLKDHEPLIVNAAGHLAGAIVFGLFLVLALRGRGGRRSAEGWLSVASAALAWLWNAGSFATLILPTGTARWVLEAISFSSLSLLPAVLLDLSLKGRFRSMATTGYLLSAFATAMHISERLQPALNLHKWALWVITAGFGVLILLYVVEVLIRGGKEARNRTSQIVASMCLLLFVVTFSHFGAGHPPQPWSRELLLHHAGIPVALLILLQDYRFVFLDAFVSFLANVILAGFVGCAAVNVGIRLAWKPGASPVGDSLAVAGLCGLMILFAYFRGIVQRCLTRAVFRRGGLEVAVQDLRAQAGQLHNESAFLEWASERLAAFAGTPSFELLKPKSNQAGPDSQVADLDYSSLADKEPSLRRDPRRNWAEVVVPIRLSHRDTRILWLGRRRGGRRYLSEDFRSLNYLATVVSEEVERFRAAEMQRLVSEAELRALHSQINPHFLFNALNTIYGIIPREAAGARRTVLNLAEIFRYFLQSDRILIPLSEEVKIVKAYLEIERFRMGPRLQTLIQVAKDAEQTLIPILSVQPLVENAIKHGLAMCPDEGWLRLTARQVDGCLTVIVEDSGKGATENTMASRTIGTGVGLANVTRRLQLCFGPDAGVDMVQGEFGTRVQFSIPLAERPAHQ